MPRLRDLLRPFGRLLAVVALAVVCGASAVGVANAQGFDFDAPGTQYPCGVPGLLGQDIVNLGVGAPLGVGGILGTQTSWECHWYDYFKEMRDGIRRSLAFLVIQGFLNTLTVATQYLAEEAAKWLAEGAPGRSVFFHTMTFEDFLQSTANDALNRQIDAFNEGYFKDSLGIDLCSTPTLANIRLSLGFRQIRRSVPNINCSLDGIRANFGRVADSLSSDQLAKTLKQSVEFGGNDLNIALSAQIKVSETIEAQRQAAIFDRQESRGFKQVKNFITGNIKLPSEVAIEQVNDASILKAVQENNRTAVGVLSQQALVAGLKQLPVLAGSTFVSTLAQIGFTKLQDMFKDVQDDARVAAVLLSYDADAGAEGGYDGLSAAERRNRAISTFMSDIFRPNLATDEREDLAVSLAACTAPRGLWGCSMDQALATALKIGGSNGALTVGQAAGILPGSTAQGLHPEWELIPEWESQANQDADCYKQAYCSANLAKLRFARILPIGWELAANSPFNQKKNGKYVTLAEVLNGFEKCNAQGQADAANPWCHLVDPYWVLTAPPYTCKTRSFTDAVAGDQSVRLRQQECTDVASCLTRDDKGNCTGGYGYCVAEKTVWRFGADQCDEKYASCRSYLAPSKKLGAEPGTDPATNQVVSYVRNTVDYGTCNVENTGCLAYAMNLSVPADPAQPATWAGDVGADFTFTAGDGSSLTMPRIYFDKTVKPCSASGEGCTKVLAIEPGASALNLLENSSFELDDASSPTKLKGWSNTIPGVADVQGAGYAYAPFVPPAGSASFHGVRAAGFPSTYSALRQIVEAAPQHGYVVSFAARNVGGLGSGSVLVRFAKVQADGKVSVVNPNPAQFTYSSGCTWTGDGLRTAGGTNAEWQRFACEFSTPPNIDRLVVSVEGSSVGVDAVQLEEGDRVTNFIDGLAGDLREDSLKIAPDAYGCTGLATDRPECKKFARVCRQTEAGCQGYTEVGGGGGPEIPATLTANDYCPATCVGYAEYRKLPSAFDLTKTSVNGTEVDGADQTSQFFIPARGQACTAEQAGCEEFTNIESQSEGGEQKAYFRHARACEVPGPESKTFFTWEGSDTAGYQLKTWSLVAVKGQVETGQSTEDENGNVSPITKQADVPKVLSNAGPDGVVKTPAACNETSWKQGTDPDCRQFYNEAGDVAYIYYSQTVASSALCTSFRKPAPNVDDCVKTGGEYRADQAVCVYKILPSESVSCPAAAAGCRAWIGTGGRNASNAVLETFVSGAGAFKAEAGSTVKTSKEALQVGDQSLQVTKSGQGLGGVSVSFDAPSGAALYQVTFWAKAPSGAPGSSGRMTLFARGSGSSVTVSQNVIQLLPDWRRFQAGPFVVSPKDGKAELVFAPAEVDAYIDTVTVQRVQDLTYVKMGSWTTPAECDLTAQGIPQPQAMLGCQAYQDRRGTTVAVREFGSLCRFESIGCTAYVDTRNSASPYAESVTLKGAANAGKAYDNLFAGDVTITRPGDRYVYLIDEPSAHCAPDQRSCRAFGKPKWNADGLLGLDTTTAKADAASRFETVYLIDDIEKYQKDGEPAALCRPSELFCDAFKSGETTSYFRDPGDRVCEWKESVTIDAKTGSALVPAISAGQYSGWFRKGTNRPCYPELLSGAKTFLVHYPSASGYTGQVALCPKDQSECTEFRDPADTSDLNYPQGKPYFFINNQKVDKTTCAKFDPYGLGCVLIRDQSSGNLAYSAKATNRAYLDRGRVSVSPIDCTNPRPEDAAYCKGAGTCQMQSVNSLVKLAGEDEAFAALQGASCSQVSDCSMKIGAFTFTTGPSGAQTNFVGSCQVNDANVLAKIKLDRDCSEWMACKAGETVYDESQRKYVTVCTDYGLCSQSSGSTQSAYCRATVERTSLFPAVPKKESDPKPEMVLRQGVFLDAQGYGFRAFQSLETIPTLKNKIRTAQADYSGYSIPNRFQAVDMMARRVGFELLTQLGKPEKAKNYADDYRMVARVPMVPDDFGGAINELPFMSGMAQKFDDPKYPTLKLCRHGITGQVGYHVPSEGSAFCHLAVDTVLTQVVSDAAGSANKRDAQKLADIFDQDPDPRRSIFLQQAAPGVDCRAQPDAGAPFGNEFVADWDLSVQPPKPKGYAAGYEGVATCERGEDCSCQYAKVSYGNQTSKYYELLSRQAPPQGVCQGGPKNGGACIPAVSGGLGNAADLDALVRQAVSAEADNPCGAGGVCQPLTNSTIVRGIGGYCIQRDTAVTVGDKGRYQCLSWHPQAVLNGTRDVYHFDPQVGYYPPINSGEYFCVAPSYAPASGEPVRAGDDVGAPGSMSSIQYDERCVSANWSALEERAQGFNYYVKYEQQNDDYDEPDEYQVSAAITGSNDPSFVLRRIGKKQPVCTNVDGSDIKKSKAAEHCAALKPVDWVKGNYAYGQQIGDGNIIGDIISLGKGALTNYVDAYLSLIELPDLNLKDVLLQPLQNLWNFGTNLVNIFSCITGQSGCLPQQKTVSSFWGRRVLDRASFAIPGSKLDNPAEDTTDAQTLRMVATGEGTNRSYAEYFIPASSTFGKGDVGMLESQIGYFKLRVPRPGDAAPEYPDEAGWSPKMKAPAVAPDRGPADPQNLPSTDYSHLSRAPSIDRVKDNYRPDKVTDSDWGILWFQANSLVRQDKNVGPVNKTMDWAFFREKDPAKRVKDGGDVGQLGCVMTEKWVDEVADFSDWSTEQQVVQATKQWHQGFQKQFAGLLSRADSGVVKNADGTYLRQLPCASDAKKLCYYRYWQTDYRSAGQDMFGMFDADKNSNLPAELGSKATYFKRAQGSKPYFSIRAMFESQSAEDNAKSPLDQPIDGSGLQGPFKFVGFWVTAAAPGSSDAQHVYMRVSTVDSNACRDVAQVISPKDRSNAAFTDRTWAQGGYIAPSVTANYGTPNIPFGAAIHQKPIGKDPMLMLDVAGGVVDPSGAFVKPGTPYSGVTLSPLGAGNYGPYQYNLLSNVFARIYRVYHYHELPVRKGDSMCFLGPLMGQKCSKGTDCNPNGTCMYPSKDGGLLATANKGEQGTCIGGIYSGRTCTSFDDSGTTPDCSVRSVSTGLSEYIQAIEGSCLVVANQTYPIPTGKGPNLLVACAGTGDPSTTDPDKDDNRCTHGVGYHPRLDVCPADDLECLLSESLSGDINESRRLTSPPKTDVTSGHYAFNGDPGTLSAQEGLPRNAKLLNDYRNQRVVEAYIPKAPRVAAPDTSRQCPSPGQCPIARMDAISVEGAAEGPVILYGNQANVTTRFYAWSADNQAPIASLWVDWSDGAVQKTDGARIKNAKPFCGIGRQCEFAPGLSCVSDADCPTGAGKCFDTGVCSNDSGKACFYNADCGDAASTCVKRLTYGNSPDACEPNYREFTHSYECSQAAVDAGKIPACSGNGVANGRSCYVSNAEGLTCRFVPRVYVKDNWGWCTGNCSKPAVSGDPKTVGDISLRFAGGCYDGSKSYISTGPSSVPVKNSNANFCDAEDLTDASPVTKGSTPWLPYKGYVELRAPKK